MNHNIKLIFSMVVMIVISITFFLLIYYIIKKHNAILYAFNNNNWQHHTSYRCPTSSCIPKYESKTYSLSNPKIYDVNLAIYCANLIAGVENKKLPGKVINYDKNNDTFGYINYDVKNNTVWISFRGTHNLSDVSNDSNFKQKSMNNNKNMLVHSGFLNISNKVLTTINEYLHDKKTDKQTIIVITGHSLGAAVATVIGAYLQSNYNTVLVYNFASPRVGNDNFVKNCTFSLFRIVNKADIVPHMPFPIMPNYFKKNVYKYKHAGIEYSYYDNWGSISWNHYLQNYIDNIKHAKV